MKLGRIQALLSLILVLALVFSLAACGTEKPLEETGAHTDTTTAPTEETTAPIGGEEEPIDGREETLNSIEKLTDGVYTMTVKYDYDLDKIIADTDRTKNGFFDAAVAEIYKDYPAELVGSVFGCSVFGFETADGKRLTGRNYDFNENSALMLVSCAPKNGFRSIGSGALGFVGAKNPTTSEKDKMLSLLAPMLCLDGLNEKGVSISILWVDTPTTVQDSGKQVLSMTSIIRLVLDRAESTEKAVELIGEYDMNFKFGDVLGDFHFYITDAKGDNRMIEFDPKDTGRRMVATPVEAGTNFYTMYHDTVYTEGKAYPDSQKIDGKTVGGGVGRWVTIEKIINRDRDSLTAKTAWDALRAAAQLPKSGKASSVSTLWSVVYNNTDLTAELVYKRDWDNKISYSVFDLP